MKYIAYICIMKNEEIIKENLKKRGFKRMICRDTWTRGTWTARFYEDDIEVYDDISESRFYYIGNVNSLNIEPILNEIDVIVKNK